MVEALRYKLRCFGVPVDGPTEVLCDNNSVVTNSSVPASTLNKRHNAICYHRVREAQTCGMIKVLWIEGKYNLADLLSKTTIAGDARWNFVNQIFYKSDSLEDDYKSFQKETRSDTTLFYDGTRKLYNWELHLEWFRSYRCHYKHHCGDIKGWVKHHRGDIKRWEEWDLSNECKEYLRERQSWQQIIVVEGVTEIPEHTFSLCSSIQKVIFANTVVRIEEWAFANCEGLVYIKLSINLEYMGELSFQGCNLFSVFIPPLCREVEKDALAYNENVKIVNVPQDVELEEGVFAGTKLIVDSPFGDEEDGYDHTREETHEWIKNVNNDDQFSLHRACCSFQPAKEVIMTIVLQQGFGAFSVENQMGVTPSQYMKANPFIDISEKDIIEEYIMKMMGEIR